MSKLTSSASVLAINEYFNQWSSKKGQSASPLILRTLTLVEKVVAAKKYSEGDIRLPWCAVVCGSAIIVVSDNYQTLVKEIRQHNIRLLDVTQLG